MKIDVEGYEGPCLRGMGKILEKSRPIIFFECIDETSGQQAQELLAPLGYSFFEIDELEMSIARVDELRPLRDAQGRLVAHRFNRLACANTKRLEAATAGLIRA